MKVEEILMVIIGILSLIIFYKIFKGSLVEGVNDASPGPPKPTPAPSPTKCELSLEQTCGKAKTIDSKTCEICVLESTIQRALLFPRCTTEETGNFCNGAPPPPPVGPRTGCGAERQLNLPDRPGGTCSSVDNAEQCNVSWIRDELGENFTCNWSWDKKKCEQTTNTCYEHRGQRNLQIEHFCKSSSEEQWHTCNNLKDKTSCTQFGDGCKWTSKSAFGGSVGGNNYPGCIVNCTGCNTISVGVNREEVDKCVNTDSVGACDSTYEVPNSGNTKLCIKEKDSKIGCNPGYGVDGKHDRFCTRQRFSLDCEEQDDDGFCYTTGDI